MNETDVLLPFQHDNLVRLEAVKCIHSLNSQVHFNVMNLLNDCDA